MNQEAGISQERWAAIRALVRGKRKVCILTHENPDPDSIAGAFALQYLLAKTARVDAVIVYSGMVWRAENRAMVKHLRIQMIPSSEITFSNFRIIALVDTQPGAGNNALPAAITPSIVLDHHGPLRRATAKCPVIDVRRDYGSVSTILTEYFDAAGLAIAHRVATALFYGLKTDTRDLQLKVHAADKEAYRKLLSLVSWRTLGRIQQLSRPLGSFRCYYHALRCARLYGQVIVSAMRGVSNPDFLAILADAFIAAEGVTWALVCAPSKDAIYFSVRCSNRRRDAGRLVRKALGRLGSGGGHMMMAGGKIPLAGKTGADADRLMYHFIDRFLALLQKTPERYKMLLDAGADEDVCLPNANDPEAEQQD